MSTSRIGYPEEEVKERLIELVREQPVLWNQRDAIYKSKKQTEKNLMWAMFAGQLGLPDGKYFIPIPLLKFCQCENNYNDNDNQITVANFVKAMRKSLRNQFVRETRKIPRFSSGMENPEDFELYTSWHFFRSLLFLRSTVGTKKGTGNLDNYEVPSNKVEKQVHILNGE